MFPFLPLLLTLFCCVAGVVGTSCAEWPGAHLFRRLIRERLVALRNAPTRRLHQLAQTSRTNNGVAEATCRAKRASAELLFECCCRRAVGLVSEDPPWLFLFSFSALLLTLHPHRPITQRTLFLLPVFLHLFYPAFFCSVHHMPDQVTLLLLIFWSQDILHQTLQSYVIQTVQ